jgi:hypothetical protein
MKSSHLNSPACLRFAGGLVLRTVGCTHLGDLGSSCWGHCLGVVGYPWYFGMISFIKFYYGRISGGLNMSQIWKLRFMAYYSEKLSTN